MKVASRIPVGTEEVIRTAPAARLRDLYDRYYRPERATLVMVGDFDPAAIEAKIKARFGDWKGRGPAGADPDIGNVDYRRAAAADDFIDPAIQDSVTLTAFRPWVEEADTKAKRARTLAEDIGEGIVSRRLAKIALNEDSPILAGYFAEAGGWKIFDQVTVGALAKEGAWKEALALIEQEQRRAIEHGFTQAEVDEQLATRRTAFRNAVAGVTTRRSDALADTLVTAAKGDFVFVRPETSQALVRGDRAVAQRRRGHRGVPQADGGLQRAARAGVGEKADRGRHRCDPRRAARLDPGCGGGADRSRQCGFRL